MAVPPGSTRGSRIRSQLGWRDGTERVLKELPMPGVSTMRGAMPITLLVAMLTIASPALAAWGMPEGVTDRMDIINGIYGQILLAGVIVFLFVMAWMLVAMVRFRPGGAGKTSNEAHRGSIKAELVWTIIPFLIVAWVGLISYDGLIELRQSPEIDQDLPEVKITGFQWFWEAEYENGVVITANPGPEGQLDDTEPFLIPADQEVLLNITAGDVIHALWIPELGIKYDANPHQPNYAVVDAPEGSYFTQCAEYCGLAHAYMRAQIDAVPPAEFEAWLEDKRAEQISGGNLITVTDDGVEPGRIQAVANAPFEYLIRNDGSQPVEAGFAGTTVGPISPGQWAWLNTTAPEAGEHELTVGEHTVTVEVIEPTTVDVELGDFVIHPELSEFEAGQAYLLNVTNTHTTVHNLFLGLPQEEAGEDQIIADTANLQPGESAQLLFIPEETGSFTMWCDVPGHYSGGMFTGYEVTGSS